MNIGERIKELRKQKNMSATSLGESLRLSQSSISKIENNQQQITIQQLMTICDVFEIEITSFFSRNPYMKKNESNLNSILQDFTQNEISNILNLIVNIKDSEDREKIITSLYTLSKSFKLK